MIISGIMARQLFDKTLIIMRSR